MDAEGIYKKVVRLAVEALRDLQQGEQAKTSARELLEFVKQKHPEEVEEVRLSWNAYLTKASQDPTTSIVREPGKYGFMLKQEACESAPEPSEPEEQEAEQPEDKEERQYTAREAALYEVLRDWLSSRDYRADIPASTKKGGAWGNPDVVGIKILDDPLGNQHIELATIEAKVSDANWKRFFFEAVAHKRFAHRAYFAFAVSATDVIVSQIKDYEELREYGERYNVGVLVIFIDPETYRRLTSEKGVLNVELGDVRVEEVWPAVYAHVPPQPLTNYVRGVLELLSSNEVHTFGGA